MKQIDLKRRVGNIEQLAYVREATYTSGKANGVRILEVNNGLLSFTVLLDRGFDISDMRYQNVNLSFISKNGVVNPHLIFSDANKFTAGFTAGFLYTCGIDNVGGDKFGYVTHGSQTTVPTTVVNTYKYWEDDEYIIKVVGVMHNTSLFGQNVTLVREYKTSYMSDTVYMRDEFINEAFVDAKYKLLYHFNFGYPLVDDGAVVEADITSSKPRTEFTSKHMHDFYDMAEPKDVYEECVYFHTVKGDNPTVAIRNEKLGLRASLTYSVKNLPLFVQWKSEVSGDYVIGLEPASTNIDEGDYGVIPAQKSIVNDIAFTVKKI